MFESIKTVLEIFSDKTRSFGFKSALFISIVGFLFIFDLTFHISYDIHISNKLNNLEKIYQLKQIYKNDSLNLEKFSDLEKKILNRKHYSEYLPFYNYSKKTDPKIIETIEIKTTQGIQNEPFHLNKNDSIQFRKLMELSKTKIESKNYSDYIFFFDSLRNNQLKSTDKTIVKTISRFIAQKTDFKERSRKWMFISSNFFFILLFVFIFFVPFLPNDQKKGSIILGIFAINILLSCIMLFAYWTSYFIPLIFNIPIWNYILNFLIHSFFITVIVNLILRVSKKK
jgi:hypothetical protein